jgi:hypothetical protein
MGAWPRNSDSNSLQRAACSARRLSAMATILIPNLGLPPLGACFGFCFFMDLTRCFLLHRNQNNYDSYDACHRHRDETPLDKIHLLSGGVRLPPSRHWRYSLKPPILGNGCAANVPECRAVPISGGTLWRSVQTYRSHAAQSNRVRS